MKRHSLILAGVMLFMALSTLFAANDRPLIFGQNPVPSDWWGHDKNVGDPKQFDKIAESGGTSCRIGMGWDNVEPVRGGGYDWSNADRWITYCIDRGINPVLLFGGTPKWAFPDNVNPNIPVPEARYGCAPEFYPDFEKFVYAMATHFRGRVQYYEFWNEANGMGWHWIDKGYGPVNEYAPLMIRAYKQIKLADPTAKMSTTGLDDNSGYGDDYIRRLYAAGCKGYFDAVAEHPYSGAHLDEWKLDDIRKTLDDAGDHHVDIWITEIGWTANGREETIAGYITDYLDKLIKNHPTVKIATYHTAMDFPWEDYGYGLIDKNFQPKVTWQTFKDYPKPKRPAVSNVTATPLSASTASIKFTTDMPSKSMVMHGLTDRYGMVTGKGKTLTKNHQFKLVGLIPGKTYHYRIRVGAVDYGDTYSADFTFATPDGKTAKFTSDPKVEVLSPTSVLLKWTTDIPSTGMIEYGQDFSYGSLVKDNVKKTSHEVRLNDIAAGKNYQLRVTAIAAGYSSATKEAAAFNTTATDVPAIIGSSETYAPVAVEHGTPISIAEAKALPDASKATITGIVTHKRDEGMTFRTYIQDKGVGICISTTSAPAIGDEIKATGVMSILNGERVMTLAAVTVIKKNGTLPEPVKVSLKELGGGALGMQGAVIDDAEAGTSATGPNNIGLLVETTGKVTHIDKDGGFYYIDDGSGINDGSGHTGVRVASGRADSRPGSEITVRGISSIVMVNGKAARLIRP